MLINDLFAMGQPAAHHPLRFFRGALGELRGTFDISHHHPKIQVTNLLNRLAAGFAVRRRTRLCMNKPKAMLADADDVFVGQS